MDGEIKTSASGWVEDLEDIDLLKELFWDIEQIHAEAEADRAAGRCIPHEEAMRRIHQFVLELERSQGEKAHVEQLLA